MNHNPSRDTALRRRIPRPLAVPNKRPQSASPLSPRPRSSDIAQKAGRRCSSLSPNEFIKKSADNISLPAMCTSTPSDTQQLSAMNLSAKNGITPENDAIPLPAPLPQSIFLKLQRQLNTKKRDFVKLKKNLMQQQKTFLEAYASIREVEGKVGAPPDEAMGDVRVVSVASWPPHDLLLLVRDDFESPLQSDVGGAIGPQVLSQLHAQLTPIWEDVQALGTKLIGARSLLLRNRERSNHGVQHNKGPDIDVETERLNKVLAEAVENIKVKINYALQLASVPWIDRDTITKRSERLQKDNMLLQHRLEEMKTTINGTKSAVDNCCKEAPSVQGSVGGTAEVTPSNYQNLMDELSKERSAREALKNVVSAAESMLRVARARIATLERQLKDTKAELDSARRKHKDLEQLYRQRESSYDARSKKLMEVSKTGEMAIEALQRQRDALELRVKELHEQAELAEKMEQSRQAEQRYTVESLQAKEKQKEAAEIRIMDLESKVKGLEDIISNLRERSRKLVDMERKRCLDYVPTKETEPTDRETELWKELQATRLALSRAEEDLRQSRIDKDNFLNSLSKIAQEGGDDNGQEKTATILLEKEQKIVKMQQVIEELRDNEKSMEQTMTQYENQLASLRLEVKRLRNYDCYSKDVPYQELQTELLDLNMQVESLMRERSALVSAAASRALMLERHERAADLFARVTRARRELIAIIDGRQEPQPLSELANGERDTLVPKRWLYTVSRSLSSVCASSAETWTALCAERARVLRLESAVLAQSLQLEREGRVRTQFERRRAILERQVMRVRTATHTDDNRGARTNETPLNARLVGNMLFRR